jgi:predicted transport protein
VTAGITGDRRIKNVQSRVTAAGYRFGMDVDAATQTMIDNMPAKTGRSLDEWFVVVDAAGYEKHGQILSHLKSEYGVSHGFANLIAARSLSRGQAPTTDDLVEAQYAGRKAPLRPLYDRLIAEVSAFGPDVEVAPKKTGVSLRRNKQFAVIEAPSATRLQLGVNLRGATPTERLRAAGGMCTHRVDVASAEEIDAELVGWLHEAYEEA